VVVTVVTVVWAVVVRELVAVARVVEAVVRAGAWKVGLAVESLAHAQHAVALEQQAHEPERPRSKQRDREDTDGLRDEQPRRELSDE